MMTQTRNGPHPASGLGYGSKPAPTMFMMDLWATVPYYTAYLSKALLKAGARVRVGSITYYLDTECFSRYGIPLRPGLLNVVGRCKLPRLLRRVLKLGESLLNLGALSVQFLFRPPDIVHVQYLPLLRGRLPLDLWFVKACQRRGSKILLTVHDLLPHDTADRYRATFRQLYSQVDGIICHSEHIRERLAEEFGVEDTAVAVIPHGPFFYDLPMTAGAAARWKRQDELLVLWQGILFPYKGVDVLLEAWRRVEAEVENAWLLIAGTGPPELLAEVRGQIDRLGLRRVRLELTFVSTDDLVAMYRAADIVAYPYRAITTSGALATGLALGKTIVASDLPVFRELLTPDVNSRLVEAGNTEELGSALSALLQDPASRDRLSSRVREMNFGDQTWEKIAAQTIDVYAGLCS